MNKKVTRFSPEVRERAVRLVREQRSEHPSMWAAVESIAPMEQALYARRPGDGRNLDTPF
ncbi:hypothetical protein FAZ98_22345 [Paraburkholderia acidisoli]|uniref:Transposase n=1 Tax=Paraburkholderia acidisoli TaxID=2571748 RepID=A0A7Z2GN36_9BURK|nr:hypothetical protein FAZ98_22345 [Paraburkholderia acidisoli]